MATVLDRADQKSLFVALGGAYLSHRAGIELHRKFLYVLSIFLLRFLVIWFLLLRISFLDIL